MALFLIFAPMPNFDNLDFIARYAVTHPVASLTERNKPIPQVWVVDVCHRKAKKGLFGKFLDGIPDAFCGTGGSVWIVDMDEFTKAYQVGDSFGEYDQTPEIGHFASLSLPQVASHASTVS